MLALLVATGAAACGPTELQRLSADQHVGGEQKHVGDEASEAKHIQTVFGSFDPLSDASHWPGGVPTAIDPQQAGRAQATLVQFVHPVGMAERTALQHAGLDVRGYFPEDTLLVDATAQQQRMLQSWPGVRAALPMPSALKIDPQLLAPVRKPEAGAPVQLSAGSKMQQVAVFFFGPVDLVALKRYLSETDSRILESEETAIRAEVDAAGLFALAAHPNVVSIEPYHQRRFFNERSRGMLQGGRTDSPTLASIGLRGEGQVVAVADSGLDISSVYFTGRDKIVAYQDFAGNDDGDATGHGTHVAGSIAGERAGDRYEGVAPAARLVVQDLAAGDEFVGLGLDLTPILSAAYMEGARIHSNSWGTNESTYNADARAIDRYVMLHPDFLVIAANGNGGHNGSASVSAPATAKNVISVGAIDSRKPSVVAAFSAQGPTADGRIKPTLLAPGVDVRSAGRSRGPQTEVLSGTSMSAPMIAGAAALLRQFFVEGRYPSGQPQTRDVRTPSAALLKAVLLASTVPLDNRIAVNVQGFGRVQLGRILAAAQPLRPPNMFVLDDSIRLSAGEGYEACFDVADGADVDVVLTWTDPPAAPGAMSALVHDLDLQVVDAKGKKVWGNGGKSKKMWGNGGADNTNVEEVVRLREAPFGKTCARVSARRTAIDKQSFALVIRGVLAADVSERTYTP